MTASRTKSICRSVVAVAVCAGAVTATTGTAQAKKANPNAVKQVRFKATLSGSQVTTWEYHHKRRDGDCDVQVDGNGDQTIKFDAGRKFKLTFSRPPKSNPNLFLTDGRPAVLTSPIFLNVDATAERQGDETYGQPDPNTCTGDNGGADPGYVPPERDCGARDGRFHAKLYFHDSSADADLFVPIGGFKEKNLLRLEGSNYAWTKPGGEDASESLDNTYVKCPLRLDHAYIERPGHIYISPAKLSEKQLFGKKRKFVVSGHHIQPRNEGEATGQTIIAWNLRLTRVR
jgi:hypothetical protein